MSNRKTIDNIIIGVGAVTGLAVGAIVGSAVTAGILGVAVGSVAGAGGGLAGAFVGMCIGEGIAFVADKVEKFTSRVPAKAAAANSQGHIPRVTGSNLDYTTPSPALDSSLSNSFQDASLRMNQGTQIMENTAERTRPEVKQQPHQPRNTR
jgi:hypothetical protein